MEALSKGDAKLAKSTANSLVSEFEGLVADEINMIVDDIEDESGFYIELIKQFKKLI
ncbi:MAG: hypothetical protein HKO92_06485 [Flavobacteriaceae bacterium]|nr:hypothetical protein [Flavobacteriaceae bacterium]